MSRRCRDVAQRRNWSDDTCSKCDSSLERLARSTHDRSERSVSRRWERTVVFAEMTTVRLLHSLANCFSRNVERVAILRRLALNMVRWTLYPGQGTPARTTSGQLVGEIRRSYLDKFGSMIRTVGSSWPSRIVHHFRTRPVDMVSMVRHSGNSSCRRRFLRAVSENRCSGSGGLISMWSLWEYLQEYLPNREYKCISRRWITRSAWSDIWVMTRDTVGKLRDGEVWQWSNFLVANRSKF